MGVLDISPNIPEPLPVSLTTLKIYKVTTNNSLLEYHIPKLVNLTYLTIPHQILQRVDHYTVRNLPIQLAQLTIINPWPSARDLNYYLPLDVIRSLPATITKLDVGINIHKGGSVENLDRLHLKELRLVSLNRVDDSLTGTFPHLEQLSLVEFNSVKVPLSVTSLDISSTRGPILIPSEVHLRKLIIPKLSMIHPDRYREASLISVEEFSSNIDMYTPYSSITGMLPRFNPLILSSLTMVINSKQNTLVILKSLANDFKMIKRLNLSITDEDRAVVPQEFNLPSSITDLSLNFKRGDKLQLLNIPLEVTILNLNGVIVDIQQLSQLSLLHSLSIDSEAIMGLVYHNTFPATRRYLEFRMISFLMNLPSALSDATITREQVEDTVMVYAGRVSVGTYQLTPWLNSTPCRPDIRQLIPKIMMTLILAYYNIPY